MGAIKCYIYHYVRIDFNHKLDENALLFDGERIPRYPFHQICIASAVAMPAAREKGLHGLDYMKITPQRAIWHFDRNSIAI